MRGKIAPSLMCVDLMNVERDIRILEEANVDYLHIDIMDNHFVPNVTLGFDFVDAIRKITNIPLDIHLMIENPENSLSNIKNCDSRDIVSLHYESTRHIHRALNLVKELGVKVGVAINPGTPIQVLEDLLPDLDIILVMTVNPGFAGQQLVPATLNKIAKLRKMLDVNGYSNIEIEVDGNVSFEKAKLMYECGADIYVGGSSSIFYKDSTILANSKKMRSIVKA